jgi:nucleoside-specific outer membrane channel protein Tsx
MFARIKVQVGLSRDTMRGLMGTPKHLRVAPATASALLTSTALTAFAALAADLPVVKAPEPPPFFVFQDTLLEYRYETAATEPGAALHFPKHIANVTHIDAYPYGTNFVSVDFLKSTTADPSFPAAAPFKGDGSAEVYALYRGTFSGNAFTDSKMFSFGPIKDISLGFGGDIESHNNAFAAQKRAVVVGPQISFDVAGYLTLQVNLYKEWNHNGIAQTGVPAFPANPDYDPVNGRLSFRPTAEFEAAYAQPLAFTGLPLTFSGFTNLVLPKGLDGFGSHTRTEVLSSNRLTLDVGSFWGRPKLVDAFIGYKYWLNKFGTNAQFGQPSYTPGSLEHQFFFGVDFHLGNTANLAALAQKPTGVVKKGPPEPRAAPPFFVFQDTVLEYRYETAATEPGAAVHFPKHIANVTHVDAYQYGTNFISADVLKSTSADPSAPATGPFKGDGSAEFYGIYRGAFSGNAFTNPKMFAFGPVKDISLGFGGDLEMHNNAFAAQKRAVVVGPQVSFNVPGYFTIQINLYKEWNHNGIAQTGVPAFPANPDYDPVLGRVSFRPTAEFELAYAQPLTFTGLPLTFSGFANVVLPKGLDGFGNRTKTEFLTGNRLTLDVGSFWGKPRLVDAFVGYKYWLNKFGTNAQFGTATYTPGSLEHQVFIGAAFHI